ncbi:hypothetical protein PV04_08340 [Phialophora macrospora]|uniref:BZIP domain-containing protein n=1 Tax=Phialophora macrospora TaxID=1851006 RepID=A0A0D2FDM2_9EURO|nr:hypothetical protein PV04_08340 [Phialophora macrospora]
MDRAMRPTQNKTPAHTLVRVRNNQRRHRERRREYIALLEQKVHHGERLLVEARAKIAQLEADSRYWKDRATKDHHSGVDVLATAQAMERAEGPERPDIPGGENGIPKTPDADTATATGSESDLLRAITGSPIVHESLSTIMSPRNQPQLFRARGSVHVSYFPELLLPQPCAQTGKESPPRVKADMAMDMVASQCEDASQGPLVISSCNTYPCPQGESTVPCRYASVLIAQQNVRGTDDDTIRNWLEMSFRRGRSQDEDCRVETAALFALLDFISTA